jgi:hypothetical protein
MLSKTDDTGGDWLYASFSLLIGLALLPLRLIYLYIFDLSSGKNTR